MARLRLLIPLTLASVLLSACGPAWREGGEGFVLDAETGEPVEGALVIYGLGDQVPGPGFLGLRFRTYGERTTFTDEKGHFEFENEVVEWFHGWWWPDHDIWPYVLQVAHPKYGVRNYGDNLEGDAFYLKTSLKKAGPIRFLVGDKKNYDTWEDGYCAFDSPEICLRICNVLHEKGAEELREFWTDRRQAKQDYGGSLDTCHSICMRFYRNKDEQEWECRNFK